MREDELVGSLRSLGRESVPPASPDAFDREATIDAMVHAARAPQKRTGPTRKVMLLVAAAAAMVLVGGSALAWRSLHPPRAPVASSGAAPAAVGHLHSQSGEVVVVGGRGATVAPRESGRGWPLTAEDRVATLADGHATVLVGGVASVQLSPGSEVVIRPAGGAAMDVRSGSAQFDVSKLEAGDRFVVSAPDVEITVHGTSFRVTVDPSRPAGLRTQISVVDGIVSARSDAGVVTKLVAADRWPPRTEPATTSEPKPVVAPSASPTTIPSATGKSDLSAQNALLEQAAAARARGDGTTEARSLDAFIARFPKSPGLHDAVAARMRAADRAGDRVAAARAAQRYLALFPSGPLRDEARALVTRGRSAE